MSSRPRPSVRLALAAAAGLAVVAAAGLRPAPARAAAPAAPASQPASPGNELLGSKGLNKVGPVFALKSERDLLDNVRELAKAKAKLDADNKSRLAIEREISKAKSVFSQLENDKRNDLEKLAKVRQGDAFANNQIVARLNATQDKMKQAVAYQEEQETKLRALGDDVRAKYIQLVLEMAAAGEKTSDEYAGLGKDKEVTDAVAAAKAKLGPTPEFAQQFNYVKKLRAPVFAESVPVTYEGKVPLVEVTLNGSTIKRMVLDTGASLVVIPAGLAKSMELVPAKDDPDITLTLADGRQITGKKTTLKSVRVGKFTIENVECALLPPDLVAAEALLGGSFLNHFTFKIDTAKGVLHLAQIGGSDPSKDAKDPKGAAKKPAAAGK